MVELPPDEHEALGRRALIRRAAILGAAAWTAPVIIDSLASPAGAVTNSCYLYVIQLDRNGNSAQANATIADTAACLTPTVTGLESVCSAFTRITVNGTAPVGTVTLSADYDDGIDAFNFTFSEASAPCSIVGSGGTTGTGTTTACSASVNMLSQPNVSSVSGAVAAADILNVRAWAYIAVSC